LEELINLEIFLFLALALAIAVVMLSPDDVNPLTEKLGTARMSIYAVEEQISRVDDEIELLESEHDDLKERIVADLAVQNTLLFQKEQWIQHTSFVTSQNLQEDMAFEMIETGQELTLENLCHVMNQAGQAPLDLFERGRNMLVDEMHYGEVNGMGFHSEDHLHSTSIDQGYVDYEEIVSDGVEEPPFFFEEYTNNLTDELNGLGDLLAMEDDTYDFHGSDFDSVDHFDAELDQDGHVY
jgi:hypothetical protein